MTDNIEEWRLRIEQCVSAELDEAGHKDAAHDISHVRRVWKHCVDINVKDNLQVEPLVLLAAAYFHDIINVPKNSPDRAQASRMAAQRAAELLASLDFPNDHIEEVKKAIESHSYSANIEADSVAAKIVQDADRLEALGALGIARVFYVAGQMNSALFDADDPWGSRRELDDKRYAIDHFFVKLLNIEKSMQTQTGRLLAMHLSSKMRDYLSQLGREIDEKHPPSES